MGRFQSSYARAAWEPGTAVVGDSLIQSAGGCHNGAGECVLHGKMGVGNRCRLAKGHP